MKKFILFIIIINLSFATDKIVYKKTKTEQNTLYETLISIKKGLISNVNFFIPDYLKINPKESFFHFKISYDSLNSKVSTSLSLHLKLPGLKFSHIIVKNKTTKQKNLKKQNPQTKSLYTSLTIRPYLRIRDSKLKFFIKNSFLIQKTYYLTYAFNQQFYYYPFDNYWEEYSIVIIKKNPYTFNTTVSRTKNDSFFTYTSGIYKSFIYNKRLYVLGYSFTGYTDRAPFCYSHKLNLVFRHIIRSKRIYIEFEPYLLYSKTYDYHLKEAVNISLNYKF